VVELKTGPDRRDGRGRRSVAEALTAIVEHGWDPAVDRRPRPGRRRGAGPHGAGSPFLNYPRGWAPSPFPAVLCVSVNDAVRSRHPPRRMLAEGDLVSVDFVRTLHGWCGDAARSFIVGTPRAQMRRLLIERRTRTGGGHRRGAAWQHAWRRRAPRSPRLPARRGTACGQSRRHGIGHSMHEDPHVPNEGHPGKACGYGPAW